MIGVFDSGFGGLTVLAALRQRLPQYDYLFLADSARAPEGPGGRATSRRRSRGDSTAAAAQYKLVLTADPDAAEAMVRLAAVYCTTSREESADLFARAERLDPGSAMLWLERARCEMAQGHHRAAAEAGKRALSIDPN